MTVEELKKEIAVCTGDFSFKSSKYEGALFVHAKVNIWVDYIGVDSEEEPRFIGRFDTLEEMLAKFEVDGNLFAESLLKDITSFERNCA